MKNSKSLTDIIRIAGILLLITALTAALLAVINSFTAPVIDANAKAAKQEAILELFPEATDTRAASEADPDRFASTVNRVKTSDPDLKKVKFNEVYEVLSGNSCIGYVADVSSMGFEDYISMMVGVTPDGKISGIRILEISDTPGIGQKVKDDSYLASFAEAGYPVRFGENADAISGATYSSRGVRNGVNAALSYLTLKDSAETEGEQ